MKIILAEHYGLCFGVRDAIAEAERLAAAGPLTILGELVHNPIVGRRLAARGAQQASLQAPGGAPTAQVMITAHGASDKDHAAWKASGAQVADGTCPLVRYAHRQLARLVAAGYFPVIVGQRGHVEVEGLRGDFPQAHVFLSAAELAELPTITKYGVISQTTQPIERVRALVASLQQAHPAAEVRFCDTVCQPTKNRQSALQKLIAEADTIVVVGGRHSNNTRQLVETARAAGRRAWHVEGPEEIEPGMCAGAKVIGITGGTSTLHETVAAVQARLEALTEVG